MINIVICDDNRIFLEKLSSLIYELMSDLGDECKITPLGRNSELQSLLSTSGKSINILFMDIDLGDDNGIEITKRINKDFPDIIVIYVTAYLEYASKYQCRGFQISLKSLYLVTK